MSQPLGLRRLLESPVRLVWGPRLLDTPCVSSCRQLKPTRKYRVLSVRVWYPVQSSATVMSLLSSQGTWIAWNRCEDRLSQWHGSWVFYFEWLPHTHRVGIRVPPQILTRCLLEEAHRTYISNLRDSGSPGTCSFASRSHHLWQWHTLQQWNQLAASNLQRAPPTCRRQWNARRRVVRQSRYTSRRPYNHLAVLYMWLT